MNPHRIKAARKEEALPTKYMLITVISNGNLPLQGTRLFVSIAISFSRLESIILQPVTPTALQPSPIHIVSACLPQALHFLKHLSILKAILGRYPESSRIVKNGKKIAIGGNITDTIHWVTLYTPKTRALQITVGILILIKKE